MMCVVLSAPARCDRTDISRGLAELLVPQARTSRLVFECCWSAALSIFQTGMTLIAYFETCVYLLQALPSVQALMTPRYVGIPVRACVFLAVGC